MLQSAMPTPIEISQSLHDVDVGRLEQDPEYRDLLAFRLLGECGNSADHVELRRVAQRLFPNLRRSAHTQQLGLIVGHAATLRVRRTPAEERDVTDARLEMTATAPLPYPASYADMNDDLRATLVSFCVQQLEQEREGPQALEALLRLHGWPYSERTFYVGPWKAARLRQRRRVGG